VPKLVRDLAITTLHPRETLFNTGNLAAVNAEVIVDSDGASSVALDIRGTFVGTIEVSGTVDGTNWIVIPVKPVAQALKLFVVSVTTAGLWSGPINAPYRDVRARMTAWTSGAATTVIASSTGALDWTLDGCITPATVTAVGASGATVTLSVPAPVAGLRNYLTYLSINRFAAAVLTAAAAPVTVTTTGITGALAFSFAADAAALGTLDRWREDFAFPIAASAQATAITVVAPVTTGVIWRITAGYYVAP
jgi:hypothetical protein